jgi:hypothetical protein
MRVERYSLGPFGRANIRGFSALVGSAGGHSQLACSAQPRRLLWDVVLEAVKSLAVLDHKRRRRLPSEAIDVVTWVLRTRGSVIYGHAADSRRQARYCLPLVSERGARADLPLDPCGAGPDKLRIVVDTDDLIGVRAGDRTPRTPRRRTRCLSARCTADRLARWPSHHYLTAHV